MAGELVLSSADESFRGVRIFEVARNPQKINGVELNITPGGGLQIGAPRLRRFNALVALTQVTSKEFEDLRGQLVFIDHRLNRDRKVKWVVEEATIQHDGVGAGPVFGNLTAVEDVSVDLAAGLPLGTIVIPSPPAIEDVVEEDEDVPDFGVHGNVVDWFVSTNNAYAGPRTRSVISASAPPGFTEAEDFTERNRDAATSLGDTIIDWFKPEKYPTLDEAVEAVPTPGDIGTALDTAARDTGAAIGSWWKRKTRPTQRRTRARAVVTT